MTTKYKRTKTPKREQLFWAAERFIEILERIDNRCLAADGPVGKWRYEATDDEMQMLYRLACKIKECRPVGMGTER